MFLKKIFFEKTSVIELEALDAMRGWAIALVVLLHSANLNLFSYGQTLNGLISHGQWGVQLFYLVSAFSLCLSLETRNESHAYLKFMIRRFFRIAPLYYITIIIYVLLDSSFLQRPIFLASVLTFTNGFIPAWCTGIVNGSWSIAVEMIFYLFLPFIFRYCFQWNSLFLLLVFTLGMAHVTKHFAGINHFYYFGSQLCVFVIGCMLYKIWKDKKIKYNWQWAAILPITSLIWGTFYLQHFIFGVVAALWMAIQIQFPIKIWVNTVMRFIGKVSYGIYLLHFLIMIALDRINPKFLEMSWPWLTLLARFLFVMTLSILLSMISFVAIERPGLKMGKRLINKLN